MKLLAQEEGCIHLLDNGMQEMRKTAPHLTHPPSVICSIPPTQSFYCHHKRSVLSRLGPESIVIKQSSAEHLHLKLQNVSLSNRGFSSRTVVK